jgi:hypothetical protein
LIFSRFFRDPTYDNIELEYFDIFGFGGPDSDFVITAFSMLVEEKIFTGINEITISPDNGSHFKNFAWVVYLSCFFSKYNIRVKQRSYPPYHGWGVCDAHASVCKKILATATSELEMGEEHPRDFVRVINANESLKNTKAFLLPRSQPTKKKKKKKKKITKPRCLVSKTLVD